MNTRRLIGIVGGIAAGFAAGWFLHQDSTTTDGGNSSIRMAKLEAELKTKSAEVERLSKSGGKNAVVVKTPADTPDPSKNPEVVKMQERMKKQMQDKQKLKLDERMAVLRARLGLNDKQAAALRELLEKNPAGPQAMMMQAMSGEKMDEKAMMLSMLHPGEKTAELTEKITALLTPEQQQAYATFQAINRGEGKATVPGEVQRIIADTLARRPSGGPA